MQVLLSGPSPMAQNKRGDKSLMRISGVARGAGVSTQTVEYYIMLGLIVPIRPAGKRGRFFDAGLIRRIRLIRRLNESGYTLQAIRETYLSKR